MMVWGCHQVFTEGLVKRIRKTRVQAEKTALEGRAAATSAGSAEEDIASQASTSGSASMPFCT